MLILNIGGINLHCHSLKITEQKDATISILPDNIVKSVSGGPFQRVFDTREGL